MIRKIIKIVRDADFVSMPVMSRRLDFATARLYCCAMITVTDWETVFLPVR